MALRRGSPELIAAARGDSPCDLLITSGRVFLPATREWLATELAISGGFIAGFGRREALETIDVGGAALTPGFIDAHMHLESTKLWVDEFVRTVLPKGTTAVAADPHEIANVFGLSGVAALAEAARALPFTFGICASSCVPASPFESSAAELTAADITSLLDEHGAIGLAEVMDFPGVVRGDPEVLAKVAAAGEKRVDGHAPGLSGPALDAYLAAGIESDHECSSYEEAEEKRRKGMWVFLRQGSAARNLPKLVRTVLEHGTERLALCTDDREPDSLLTDGHVNDCARLAVRHGVRLEDALVLATSNPAQYHNFHHLGWLAPGYQADICCFDGFETFLPTLVFQRGRLVAEGGQLLPGTVPSTPPPDWMRNSLHLAAPLRAEALFLKPPARGEKVTVIGIEAGTIGTRRRAVDIADEESAVARLGLVERHRASGRVGLGYVEGFGLRRGAIASSVAHDAHNIVVAGAIGEEGPGEMAAAVGRLAELGGGQVAVLDGRAIAEVPLPIGGLMSDRSAAEVAGDVEQLGRAAAGALGVSIEAPFTHLSFLGLTVIPELRITDRGVFDVVASRLEPLGASS